MCQWLLRSDEAPGSVPTHEATKHGNCTLNYEQPSHVGWDFENDICNEEHKHKHGIFFRGLACVLIDTANMKHNSRLSDRLRSSLIPAAFAFAMLLL